MNILEDDFNFERFSQEADRGKDTVLLVCSVGGHLVQMLELAEAYSDKNYVFVVNDRVDMDALMEGRTIQITHAERNIRQVFNFLEALVLVRKFRPKAILSTGAAPAVPFSIVGKYFYRSRIIFVESFSRVTSPSLTGKLMYRFADAFYVQWPTLKRVFPKAKFVGSVL